MCDCAHVWKVDCVATDSECEFWHRLRALWLCFVSACLSVTVSGSFLKPMDWKVTLTSASIELEFVWSIPFLEGCEGNKYFPSCFEAVWTYDYYYLHCVTLHLCQFLMWSAACVQCLFLRKKDRDCLGRVITTDLRLWKNFRWSNFITSLASKLIISHGATKMWLNGTWSFDGLGGEEKSELPCSGVIGSILPLF